MMGGLRARRERVRRAPARLDERHMKIHEFQAKIILANYGVPVPQGEVVETAAEAAQAATKLGTGVAVVKAQVHAGGRGKGGGVKVVKSVEDANKEAVRILTHRLVTPQTGPEGVAVSKLLVEQATNIAHEYYVAIVLDRAVQSPVLIASAEGGMDIEEVAAKTPEKIFRKTIDPALGLMPYQARNIAFKLGLAG